MSGRFDDPWRVVSDAVLRGLNHALSNRVTSLSALVSVTAADEPPGADLVHELAAESVRLEGVLRLFRLLPGARPGPAEPVLLADALADARALHALQAGVTETPCAVEGDPSALLPVVAALPGLTHALLLLLGALAIHAREGDDRAGAPIPAVLRVDGDAERVTLVGVAGGTGGSGTTPSAAGTTMGDAPLSPPAVAAAIERLLAGSGASVAAGTSEAGGVRYEVTLPTLLAVRGRA